MLAVFTPSFGDFIPHSFNATAWQRSVSRVNETLHMHRLPQQIAFLLFLVGHGTMYSREKDLGLRSIRDLKWVAAIGPPGGGRNPITPRYMRHFNIVAFTPFDEPSMQLIFKTILDWFLVKEGFESEYQRLSAPISDARAMRCSTSLELSPRGPKTSPCTRPNDWRRLSTGPGPFAFRSQPLYLRSFFRALRR